MASPSSHPNPFLLSKKRKWSSDKALPAPEAQWRSHGEANAYSAKLLDALRHVFACGGGARAMREASDRSLAAAARGRTRWSRAILQGRRRPLRHLGWRALLPKPRKAEPRQAEKAALERKARTLGRLVPGGRRLGFPALLEETCDYVAALEMQVRAMAALARALEAADGSSPAAEATELA